MIYDLNTIIREKIEHNAGKINFADFMQLVLYHPQLGYYCRDDFQLGKHGDFTTAPEVSPLFGGCLAIHAADIFTQLGTTNILEIGAGSGRLAHDLLHAFKEMGITANYFIHEISPGLRNKQQTLLKDHAVTWVETLPANFEGLIIANEVLDALPVNLIHHDNGLMKERCVSWNGTEFNWVLGDTVPLEIELPDAYQTEIHSNIPEFINKIASSLKQGVILLIDYGYGEREYYHPQRDQGTLTCFYQHQKNNNPLIHIGEQDITAHVNFTLVAEKAVENGCDLVGFTTQAAFLLECGLIDLAQLKSQGLNAVEQFKISQAIKTLAMPSEMGEIIKVMAISKDLKIKPKGFHTLDRRRDL